MSQVAFQDTLNTTRKAVDTTPALHSDAAVKPWKGWEKFLFRVAFIFFIALSIPNSVVWYRQVLGIDWTSLHYRDLYDIARFGSGINLFGNRIFGSTLLGYANWVITLIISIGLALVWTLVSKRSGKEPGHYNTLYYWLRVVVRYRAGIGIIGFGFTKLLPVQMPYPSLGLLNTSLGDFTAQKLYWMSIGVVPWYQIFAGVVEVGAGTLLLFRRTTTLGAILLFAALGDIVYVNFAYDGGVHVYSSYFVLLAAFLLVLDIPAIVKLFVREQEATVRHYYPVFSGWQQWARAGLKALTIFIFLPLFFWLQYMNFRYDPYKQPSVAGLKQLRGNYEVLSFSINGKELPPSPYDSVRWQEVSFEDWSTLTFRQYKPHPLDLSNGGGDPQRDVNRTFEISGVAGGQRAYHYYADEATHTLYLEDKYKPVPDRRNIAAGVGGDGGTDRNLESQGQGKALGDSSVKQLSWPAAVQALIKKEVDAIDPRANSARRRREFAKIPKKEQRNHMVLQYETDNGSRVLLKGVNETNDSIHVVLQRVNRKYVLKPSSLQAGKY